MTCLPGSRDAYVHTFTCYAEETVPMPRNDVIAGPGLALLDVFPDMKAKSPG